MPLSVAHLYFMPHKSSSCRWMTGGIEEGCRRREEQSFDLVNKLVGALAVCLGLQLKWRALDGSAITMFQYRYHHDSEGPDKLRRLTTGFSSQ